MKWKYITLDHQDNPDMKTGGYRTCTSREMELNAKSNKQWDVQMDRVRA